MLVGLGREAARGQGWLSVAASPARNEHFCFFFAEHWASTLCPLSMPQFPCVTAPQQPPSAWVCPASGDAVAVYFHRQGCWWGKQAMRSLRLGAGTPPAGKKKKKANGTF